MRRKARSLALQAIYQWQFTQDSFADIAAHFLATINSNKVDAEYFTELVKGVTQDADSLDVEMRSFLDRPFAELDQVELAILRLAIYELKNRLDVPVKVVLNEALELTKTFGAVESFKFINGILDKVAHKLRAVEFTV